MSNLDCGASQFPYTLSTPTLPLNHSPDKMRHCAEFAPEYEKAATALKGIATVAAVDGPKVSHKMQVQYDNVVRIHAWKHRPLPI